MRACILIALLVKSASAQSYSGHSGWSFEDTRQKATDVVVADAIAGTVADTGSQVSVKATLRVARTLAGTATPGAEVAVAWQYHPSGMGREAPLPKDPPLRGIWFWRKAADGKIELLQATGWTTSLGGYHLPAGAAPWDYRPDASLDRRIAGELAPLLVEFAARHASDLAHSPMQPGPWAQSKMQFMALTMALDALAKEGTAEVYARLSAQPDPYVKLVAISGRLRRGDAGALADLELSLPALDPLLRNYPMTEPFPAGVDLRSDLESAHWLGRLALSETPLPLLEGNAGFAIAQTRSLEMMPYLITLLDSPNASARATSLMGFCMLLGPYQPSAAVSPFWKAEMRGYCPNRAPLNDSELEARDIRFWKEWWAARREEVARTVNLPQVHPPARFQMTAKVETREVPPELRFEGFVRRSDRHEGHYHDASGAIVEGPMPRPPDPLLSRMPEPDRAAYQAILAATLEKLEQCDRKSRDLLDQARITGTKPSPEAFAALAKEREAVLKSGMAQLQARLSAESWRMIDSLLKTGEIVGLAPAAK